ncbi:MAG: orotidine-5'-phosphate decarboxylase [Chloroflexi bacterium]|nr:orotidine-5'-phosphate decarboxylase [Chloroflexota bacterium]
MRHGGNFGERYLGASYANQSFLCVGLDPIPELIPKGVDVREFLRTVVEVTKDLVCCYKPNIAFFEQFGRDGWDILFSTINAIPSEIPILLDAKRGDIGHTADAYAKAIFDELQVDAVTLNPYLGFDSLEPFFSREDRYSFVLCRTSNQSAVDLQDLQVDEVKLYEKVAQLAQSWNTFGNVGLVVGATYPEEAQKVRDICPDQLLLLPGVGAQEGDLELAVQSAVKSDGGGILVNASRGILYAQPYNNGCAVGGWAEATRLAASELRDQINMAL